MLEIIKSNTSFVKNKVENPDAWIKKVATNTKATYQKSEARKIKGEEINDSYAKDGVDSEQETQQDFKFVLKYMRKNFKNHENEIMLLHFQGEPYDSIAEIVGITPGGIANLISKLKKEIQNFLSRGSHG